MCETTPNKTEDALLWQEVTRNTRKNAKRSPQRNSGANIAKNCPTKKEPTQLPTTTASSRTQGTQGLGLTFSPKTPVKPPPPSPNNLSMGLEAGLDRRSAQRLRRGNIAIELIIDLHGLTRAEAATVLQEKLSFCHSSGMRHLLVITGKGKGLLKNSLPLLLTNGVLQEIVLAHCTAQAKDGGEGARYVLLRKKRQ